MIGLVTVADAVRYAIYTHQNKSGGIYTGLMTVKLIRENSIIYRPTFYQVLILLLEILECINHGYDIKKYF